MTSTSLPEAVPVREWLVHRRSDVRLRMDIVAVVHDLEGALDADQLGLAWWSQERLLWFALRVWLSERNVRVPDDLAPVASMEVVLDNVRLFERGLADEVWKLVTRPLPEEAVLRAEVGRTTCFIVERLGLPELVTRTSAIASWVDDVEQMRAVATTIGLAQDDEWYLGTDPGLSWSQDALAHSEVRVDG